MIALNIQHQPGVTLLNWSTAPSPAMQIETIGKFQLHLIAHEMASPPGWDPFIEIFKFDDSANDFRRVLEKQHAATHPLPSYEEAIDAARRAGTALIENGNM